jgi:hypothetical protein
MLITTNGANMKTSAAQISEILSDIEAMRFDAQELVDVVPMTADDVPKFLAIKKQLGEAIDAMEIWKKEAEDARREYEETDQYHRNTIRVI